MFKKIPKIKPNINSKKYPSLNGNLVSKTEVNYKKFL